MNKRLFIPVLICGLVAAAFQVAEGKKSVIIPNAALIIASNPPAEAPPAKNTAPEIVQTTEDVTPAPKVARQESASENNNYAAVDYYNLGISLRNEGMYEEAIKAFNQVLLMIPGYGDAHYNLALAYVALGNAPAAFEEYQILRGIDPETAEGLYNQITSGALSDMGNKFIVQVGAFRNTAYAKAMIEKLKGRYFHAYIEKTDELNKVRICGIKSKEQGNRMVLDISNEFNIKPYLVKLK